MLSVDFVLPLGVREHGEDLERFARVDHVAGDEIPSVISLSIHRQNIILILMKYFTLLPFGDLDADNLGLSGPLDLDSIELPHLGNDHGIDNRVVALAEKDLCACTLGVVVECSLVESASLFVPCSIIIWPYWGHNKIRL